MADEYTVRTDIGKIVIQNNSIREIVKKAVDDLGGRVSITNKKGRPQGLFGDDSRDIEIEIIDGRLSIKTYIVIRFGISIHNVTSRIMDSVCSDIELLTGQKPASITINVAGVMVIRGLRSNTDFEYELSMAQINARLYRDNVETVFLMTDPHYSFISSSMAKEVFTLGGSIKGLVPDEILKTMENKCR